MDTSIARSHLMSATHLLREKAGDKAMDTAAGQLILAVASLCDKLDEANRETHGPLPGVFNVVEIDGTTKRERTLSSKPKYETHTSPYRHRQPPLEKLQDAVDIVSDERFSGVLAGISARELARDVD